MDVLEDKYKKNVHIPKNAPLNRVQTTIRNGDIPRHEFVFQAERLIRLVVEEGLGLLPHENKKITTPTGA